MNEIFIEDLDWSMCQSMLEYYNTGKEATLHHLVLETTLLLKLQEKESSSKKMPPISAAQAVSKSQTPHGKKTWVTHRSGVLSIEAQRTSGKSAVSMSSTRTLVLEIYSCTTPTDKVSLLTASISSLSTIDDAPICYVCRQENQPASKCPFMPNGLLKLLNQCEKVTTMLM